MERIHRTELVGLLRASLGEEKAAQLIVTQATDLGLSTFEFSLQEATQLLEHLAAEPGIVGITAMLAKTRLARLFRDRTTA